MNIGWNFYAVGSTGRTEIHFTTSGSYSFDSTRDVPRQLSGLVLIPSEEAKVNLSSDRIEVFFTQVDSFGSVSKPFGVFRFTESSHQKDVMRLFDGTAGDLTSVTLNDRLVELKRNTGAAHTLAAGSDPSQAMQQILTDAGIPGTVSGSVSPLSNTISWDGSTEEIARFDTLATLAGHRPPWSNNSGVVRSVPAVVIQTDIIDLADLYPTAGSTVITDNYLSAPNRIIVNDNSSTAGPIVGQWDAPGSAPNSASMRGYVQTEVVSQQGLFGNAHADEVAMTLGEALIARQLDVEILQTTILDGPQVIRYDGSLWLLQSWQTSTAPGSKMNLTAKELTAP